MVLGSGEGRHEARDPDHEMIGRKILLWRKMDGGRKVPAEREMRDGYGRYGRVRRV